MSEENLTIQDILKKREDNELSFADLAEYYLNRIKERDSEYYSYLYTADADQLNEEAKNLDEEYTKEDSRTLIGVPCAVKDNILTDGMLCTAGSKILENYVAPYNATVVDELKGEGALVLGKTNMDEFAMGSSTENSAFGPTKNPLDTERVPGGSSGGSAAAVAAGLAPFAIGTDTGGSIRQPAAFCGIVGFKPTYGAVSRYGLVAMASSLDQAGTLTQTVGDAQLAFSAMTGNKDEYDATSYSTTPAYLDKKASDIKIGVAKEYFSEGLDSRVQEKVESAIEVYRSMGAQIEEVSLPHTEYSLPAYYILMPSEASSNLARYDSIRYGQRPPEDLDTILDHYLETRGEFFGPEVKRRIMLGTYTLSAGYHDQYYLHAQKMRTLITRDFDEAFKSVDAIISPATPTPPFKIGDKVDDPLQMYLSDVYTVGANLAGLPAVSIPVGQVDEDGSNLSVSMQLIGDKNKDFALLDIARLYEQETQS